MVAGQYSDSTCNEACWYAKEEICKCMCGGANHGLYKRDPDAPQPERTMRVKSARFRLYAVASYFDSHAIMRAFYNEGPKTRDPDPFFPDTPWYKHPVHNVKVKKGTEAQILKWPEFQPFFANLKRAKDAGVTLAMGDIEPFGVWIPVEITQEWLDVHPIEYHSYLTSKMEKVANV